MAHAQQVKFCSSVKKNYPHFFSNRLVLDVGSLDINGNNLYLFDECHYWGIDLSVGKNVDLAVKGHELALPDESIDVIISTECFEHDPFYALTIQNIIRMLKPGGLFLFTCATTGRPEHGTQKTTPQDAPFVQSLGDWADYYKNLEEKDIRDFLNVESTFESFEFSIEQESHDLYFWGVKKGVLNDRNDYSFQLQNSDLREKLNLLINEKDEKLKIASVELKEKNKELTYLKLRFDEMKKTLLDQEEKLDLANIDFLEKSKKMNILESELSECRKNNIYQSEIIDKYSIQFVGLQKDRVNYENRIEQFQLEIDIQNKKIERLSSDVTEKNLNLKSLKSQMEQVINSNSWQLTKPLRVLARFTRGEFKTGFNSSIFSNMLGRYKRLYNQFCGALRYVRRADFDGLLRRIIAERKNLAIGSIAASSKDKLKTEQWVIMTPPHTLFTAYIIQERLQHHGFSANITIEQPDKFDANWYVVICPQVFKKLPPGERRIPYQMEQSVSSRWFTPQYLSDLENSLAVIDYSLVNIEYLQSKGIAYPHVHYLPVGASTTFENQVITDDKTDVDVLFYGDSYSSARRRNMLEALQKHFKVLIINEMFSQDVLIKIKNCKVVINIHYYENALLEMPRIQECLSLGVPVVSESSRDICDYPELNGAVIFFEQDSIDSMIEAVKSVIKVPIPKTLIQNSVALSAKRFAFNFDRFMVAMGFLDAIDVKAMDLPLSNYANLISLSLPETIKRRRLFEEVRPKNCEIFDGIRRRPGWIGCALSYSIMADHALKNNMTRINIMEDDVLFPDDFETKLNLINKYLDKLGSRWDVFAGVIAALHPDVEILSVETYKGVTFATINKMTSTVFNIYSVKALQLLSTWDPNNDDPTTNTIDRYLESQVELRVVVALPFFVGHREELYSTLWGFQNTQYKDMIAESEAKLMNMILDFKIKTSM